MNTDAAFVLSLVVLGSLSPVEARDILSRPLTRREAVPREWQPELPLQDVFQFR